MSTLKILTYSISTMRFNFLQHRQILLAAFAVILAFAPLSASFAQEDGDTIDPVLVFYKGQDAHEKGNLEEAVKLYKQAIELAPEFPEAEYQLGVAFLALNKDTEAEKAFRRSLEIKANWSLPMTSLGALLVNENNKNKFAEAEKLLTTAAAADENNFLAYSALTDLRLKTNSSPEILKELLAKVKILTSKANPTAGIWTSRAAIERRLGDKDQARKSLSRALEINPRDKFAISEHAELALSDADFKSAQADAAKLEQIAPDSVNLKVLQAKIYQANGKSDEAVKVLDSIAAPDANVSDLLNQIRASSSENAADLEKLLENDEKNITVLSRLCGLLRLENPAKALDYCRRASELEPTNINHAVGYGAALVQAGDYVNAAQLFRKLIEVSPENYTAHANLATALFQLNQFGDAKKEFLWLSEKQPDLPVTYYFLAISHDRLEEYPDAMANYQKFLRLADAERNKLEIDKVNLRLPSLEKQIKRGKGRKK